MKIGFIGGGNMGSAMMKGILDSGKCTKEELMASARTQQTLQEIGEQLGIRTTRDNREVAAFAGLLFLSVKPQQYEAVISEIAGVVRDTQVIVTIAPGKSLAWLAGAFQKPLKIIRAMPNTPAMVGAGMMGLCPNELISDEDLSAVREVCSGFGETEVVPENLMDVVTAVSGSSPAYVFLFIEALADGAVAGGMPRAQAYTFAAQAVMGSAKMVLETGRHPGDLKDMVCSPGGTTIEAVRVLEGKGFRSAAFEAVKACIDKARKM